VKVELEDIILIKEMLNNLKKYERLENSYKIAIGKIQALRTLGKEKDDPAVTKKREKVLQKNLIEVKKKIFQTRNILDRYNAK
jgi:hypothetical protein